MKYNFKIDYKNLSINEKLAVRKEANEIVALVNIIKNSQWDLIEFIKNLTTNIVVVNKKVFKSSIQSILFEDKRYIKLSSCSMYDDSEDIYQWGLRWTPLANQLGLPTTLRDGYAQLALEIRDEVERLSLGTNGDPNQRIIIIASEYVFYFFTEKNSTDES